MNWYLALVQQFHDQPKSRKAWVLVQAPDPAAARSEGAAVVTCRWPGCRGAAAIVLSLNTARYCRLWLNESLRGKRSRRPRVYRAPYASELTVAFDALFATRGRHRQQDLAMRAQWGEKKLSLPTSERVRDEEEI